MLDSLNRPGSAERAPQPIDRAPLWGLMALCSIGFPIVLADHALGADQVTGNAPNIILILADDLGYGDIKSFGGDRCQIETPHFDRLAREGMRFTDAHVNASVCVPSRMAIMTGRYPWRFGPPEPGGPWGYLGTRLPAGQHTLGTMLRAAGYHTGYVGKWHLGTKMQTLDGRTQGPDNVDYRRPLDVGPPQFGFQESCILPGSLDMFPYAFVRNNRWVGEVTAEKGWSAFNRRGPAAEDFEDVKVLETLSGEAERFLRDRAADAQQGRPFFLYLALTSPHTPVSPSSKFAGRSKLGIYGDFVMETDACVGRVLSALDALDLADNTLVMASSDHGPASYAGRRRKATFLQMKELEEDGHFAGGPFRGYKFSVYEGGLRVPLAVRWPPVVPAGTTCGRLVGLQDLMATFAELTGTKLDDAAGPDSISFLPLLKDPTAAAPRTSMAFEASPARAIRAGAWKLALCPGSGCAGTYGNMPPRDQAWRDALKQFGRLPTRMEELQQGPFVQLFNLDEDPGETTNLAATHPGKVQELVSLLRSQISAGRSTPGPTLTNDRPRIPLFPGLPRHVAAAVQRSP